MAAIKLRNRRVFLLTVKTRHAIISTKFVFFTQINSYLKKILNNRFKCAVRYFSNAELLVQYLNEKRHVSKH